MKESDPIQVLGRGTDVQFTINDTVPFEIAEKSLREYLDVCRGLYSRGTVSVNVGRRILAPDQLSTIKGILAEETGLTVTEYWCPPEILQRALAGPDAKRALPGPEEVAVSDAPLTYQESPSAGDPEDSSKPSDGSGLEEDKEAAARPDQAPAVQQLQLAFSDMSIDVTTEGRPNPADNLWAGSEDNSVSESADHFPKYRNAEAADKATPILVDHDDDQDWDDGMARQDDEIEPGPLEELPSTDDAANDAADGLLLSPPIRGSEALIIKATCRSGEMVRYPGDVVVFGDVNPGAEIVAGGDIVVLGTLRGLAHAGCEGDDKATIIALNLEAHRLQIGHHVGEPPRRQRPAKTSSQSVNPKIAYLRRNSVFVAPFVRRREEYRGGILYEG